MNCNKLVVGGVGDTQIAWGQTEFHLPKSVINCPVKACFSVDASVIRVSYNSSVEMSFSLARHKLLKVIIHPCLTQNLFHKYLLPEERGASRVLWGFVGG